jgi:quercetin dioxygenase-like cupin family protein
MTVRTSRLWVAAGWLSAVVMAGCGGSTPPAGSDAAAAANVATPATAPSGTVTLPSGFPERPFVRVKFDELTWRPTEGNTLGVETAVVEGDPSKPGYYLTINHFPAGVMSRPHYHPDERYVIVLRGTWYTDEGDVFRPTQAVPLKPGDFMRHPKDGPHYDGALNEDTWVAISGYGPTNAKVIDGGELFGKSR